MGYQVSTTLDVSLERELKNFHAETSFISLNTSAKASIHLADLLRQAVQSFDELVGLAGNAEEVAAKTGTDEDMKAAADLDDRLAHYPDTAFKVLRAHYYSTIKARDRFEHRGRH